MACCLLLGASCTGNKVYDHYEHTPIAGWDKVEALSYDVPRLSKGGRYAVDLGLRVSEAFPFQRLTLIVEQTVYPGKRHQRDTINCEMVTPKGTVEGNGISYFQYHFRISERDYKEGDSLHITVRHNMKREIMPGIADVGIAFEKAK